MNNDISIPWNRNLQSDLNAPTPSPTWPCMISLLVPQEHPQFIADQENNKSLQKKTNPLGLCHPIFLTFLSWQLYIKPRRRRGEGTVPLFCRTETKQEWWARCRNSDSLHARHYCLHWFSDSDQIWNHLMMTWWLWLAVIIIMKKPPSSSLAWFIFSQGESKCDISSEDWSPWFGSKLKRVKMFSRVYSAWPKVDDSFEESTINKCDRPRRRWLKVTGLQIK